MASCDNEVARILLPCRQLDAIGHMVRRKPVIGIQKTDPLITFGNSKQRTQSACRGAKIAMRGIKLEMPDRLIIDPALREAVGNHDMIDMNRLRSHALQASFQGFAVFLMVRRNNREPAGRDGTT